MNNREEDKMVERIRSEYRPEELTPTKRQALHAAIQSRLSPKRRPWALWTPAFAGAVTIAALAFLVIGNGTKHPLTEPSASTALADELLLETELLDGSAIPLPEEFDAIAALFLES
jgi:hypothetical protein